MKALHRIFLTISLILFFASFTACEKTPSPKPKWNGADVIQEMNKKAFIDHPQQWRAIIKRYNYGKTIHSLKTLNQVLIAGNKHAHAVSSIESFKHINYPTISKQSKLKIINIPSFYSSDHHLENKYVNMLRNEIKQIPTSQPIILNFSNNLGGDYTVLINGLACLIPNGKLWTEISKKGKTNQIYLTPRAIKQGKRVVSHVFPHHFMNRNVLIIINEHSASAAEFAIIALKKNSKIKTIGYSTAGYTTISTGFRFGPNNKYIALIPYAKVMTVHPINGRRIFCNDPIIPDIQTIYRPINNPVNNNNLHQEPLDKDFLKNLKKAMNNN